MAGTSEEVIVPEGIPRAVQADEENREGQLRIGLPGWEIMRRAKDGSEGFFKIECI